MAFDLQKRLNEDGAEPPLRVLIVRVGAMGDVLHGLPAVAALRKRVPGCFIGWAVEPRWKSLLVGDSGTPPPVVSRIHEVPTREWKRQPFWVATLRQIVGLRRELRAEHYDICVDLQGSIRSAVIGRMAQAKRFIGPRKPAERQARALYGERVSVQAPHVIEQACELVGAALHQELSPVQVTLPVDATAERWVDALGFAGKDFILLTPAAGWGAKQWPVERYLELAQRLKQAGHTVLVNAGSSGDRVVTDAVAASGNAIAIECDLAQLIALTRRVKLVVGGDTGPVHLAAALGRPVIGLYGPTDPRRNGPYFPGARCRVLRHASSRLDHKRHPATEAGLAMISVEEVAQAAFALLGESRDNG